MRPVHVNGRFTTQAVTGVQRVAHALLAAVDRQLAEAPSAHPPWVLWCPQGAPAPALRQVQIRHCGPRGLHPHLWEQLAFPWAARGGRLLSLAGSAPWLPNGQVCTFHDAAVFDHPEAYTSAFVHWYRLLFRRQSTRAARLLTVSAFSQGRLAECLRVEPARIGVVPNGGDHLLAVRPDEQIIDHHGLRGRRVLLAVASTSPTKNLDRLVDAFARLPPAPDVRLVIVGAANPRVFAGAAPCIDDPRIVRTGFLDDAPLKALYQHATALVFPSLYEGFGLPPLEAMSCGCPVAAARAASIPEVCGDAALYFDPGSVAEMTTALHRLLGDPALLDRLSAAGHARVQALGWQAAGRRLLAEVEALG